MKKSLIQLIIIFGFLTIAVSQILAVTVTPTQEVTNESSETPTPTVVDKEIQQLKDKVASKISEELKNSKAVAGVVTNINSLDLSITTDDKTEYEVKLDEALTKYYQVAGAVTKELAKYDLKKGDYIIVTGPQFDKSVNANVIYVDEKYIVGSGKIAEVNQSDYSIKVVTEDKENFIFDIQTSTTQQMLNIKSLDIEKIGFSKFKEGDTIHFVFKKSDLLINKTRFDVLKILIIPQEYFQK